MNRDKRDAENAARRARRLADRAEERARRKEEQARHAAERAEKLAERVSKRPNRERDLEKSIEDFVDDVTSKAEKWIGDQTRGMFDPAESEAQAKRAEGRARRAREDAEKARDEARKAERAAEDLSGADYEPDMHEFYDDLDDELDVLDDEMEEFTSHRRSGKRRHRGSRKYGRGRDRHYNFYFGRAARRWQRQQAHFYRDRERKKICGVCAGIAGYFGRPAWEIRLYAVLGLIFVPSVVVPAYFITYFLMDDKPLYRRSTDQYDVKMKRRQGSRRGRYENSGEDDVEEKVVSKPRLSNVQTIKLAKERFANIENRLRQMESHVTSPHFELQKEFKKISGED